jgi:hypothetical protein
MPWVKLKRWIEVYLKRRRREWKLQVALHGLGMKSQQARLIGSGSGDETGSSGSAYEEMTDSGRVAAILGAGFSVDTRKVE